MALNRVMAAVNEWLSVAYRTSTQQVLVLHNSYYEKDGFIKENVTFRWLIDVTKSNIFCISVH